MSRIRKLFPMTLLGLIMTIAWHSAAQYENCPAFVEQALAAIEDNCAGLDRNNACYGYTSIETTFADAVDASDFDEPAERAELTALQSLRTRPLNEETQEWGIAVMNVQANVPGALPGQAVTFILLGDVEIENQVAPDEATLPPDPVEILIPAETAIYTEADADSDMLPAFTENTIAYADVLDATENWVRIGYNDIPAWIAVDDVQEDDLEVVALLPRIDELGQTPMQAFYLSTGVGSATCEEAPSSVTVRSPENLVVDLNINGADISIGSTITFQSSADDEITAIVHDGHMDLGDGRIVRSGQAVQAPVDPRRNIGEWQEIREARDNERRFGEVTEPIIERVRSGYNDAVIEVGPNDTWFSIAQRYGVDIQDIQARNGVDNPLSLAVGQRLIIPEGQPRVAPPRPGDRDDLADRVIPPSLEMNRDRIGERSNDRLNLPGLNPDGNNGQQPPNSGNDNRQAPRPSERPDVPPLPGGNGDDPGNTDSTGQLPRPTEREGELPLPTQSDGLLPTREPDAPQLPGNDGSSTGNDPQPTRPPENNDDSASQPPSNPQVPTPPRDLQPPDQPSEPQPPTRP